MIANLEDAGQCEYQSTGCADEEDGGNIEQKCNHSIGDKDDGSKTRKVIEWSEALGERNYCKVDKSTDRCIVMEGDEGVHFQSMQEDLDHYEARSLELMFFSRG